MNKMIRTTQAILLISLSGLLCSCGSGENQPVADQPVKVEVQKQPEVRQEYVSGPLVRLTIGRHPEFPSGMFLSVEDDVEQFLTIDLPDGEFLVQSDSLIQIQIPVKAETNLVGESFLFSISKSRCDFNDQLDWDTLRVPGSKEGTSLEFLASEYSDSVAGHHYTTYYYKSQQNQFCMTFSLELNSINAERMKPQVNEYQKEDKLKMMKALLHTINRQ